MPHTPGSPLAVIAISGRALAQSAVKGGFRVRVLDAFADRDTRDAGPAQCIARDHAIALDPERMLSALGDPAERSIVVGSGFERSPQLLDRLANYGTLCANDGDIVSALKEPLLAAELLGALGFEVPRTQLTPPNDAGGWLQKEIGGAGGVHVRPAAGAVHRAHRYYQQSVPGRPCSVTFLADGERAYLLGCNEQSCQPVADMPYCYVGAATCTVASELERELQRGLDRLVRVTGLRGLNGLDFMLDGERCRVLEVNPRPTATFELYDEDIAHGLVYWHVRSCLSTVPELAGLLRERRVAARAYRILFAEHALRVPEGVQYPAWCKDLPNAGTAIPAGAPVLSVFAHGRTREAAQSQLAQRIAEANALLVRWMSPAPAGCAI